MGANQSAPGGGGHRSARHYGDAVKLRRRSATTTVTASELASSGTDISKAVYRDQQLHNISSTGLAKSKEAGTPMQSAALARVASNVGSHSGTSGGPYPPSASTQEPEDDVPAWETIASLDESDWHAIKAWIEAGWKCQSCGHVRSDHKNHPHAIGLLSECGMLPPNIKSALPPPSASPVRGSSRISSESDRSTSLSSSSPARGRNTPSDSGSPRFRNEGAGSDIGSEDGNYGVDACPHPSGKLSGSSFNDRSVPPTPGSKEAAKEAAAAAMADHTKSKVLGAITRAHQVYFVDKEPNGSLTFNFLLSSLLDITESGFGFISSALVKADGSPYLKTHAMTNVAWTPELREWYSANAHKGLVFTNMNTLHGTVVLTGKLVLSNDVKNDPRATGVPPGHPELDTFLGLPLYTGHEMIGVIGLANRKGGYRDELVKDLEPLVSSVAQVMYAVNERKRRRDAEMQLASISQSTSEAILTISYSGHVTSMNNSAMNMFGFNPSTNDDDPTALPKKLRAASFPPNLMFPSLVGDSDKIDYTGRGLDIIVGRQTKCEGVRKDGKRFNMVLTVCKSTSDNRFFVAVIRPAVTEAAANAAAVAAGGATGVTVTCLQPEVNAADIIKVSALDCSCSYIWDWDIVSNSITVNEAFVRALGYKLGAELAATNTQEEWDKLIHPEDIDGVYVALKDHFDGVTDTYLNPRRFRCKNGDYKWFLNAGKIVARGDTNEPIRFVSIHTDITSVKDAEEMNRASAAKPKIETLLTVQHGVRAPVHKILTLSSTLKADPALTPSQKSAVESIHDSSESALQVLDDTFDLAKESDSSQLSIVHKETFNVLQCLERVAQFLTSDAEHKGIELLLEQSRDAPTHWFGDPGHFMQLILNLAGNAVEATTRGFVLIQLSTEMLPSGDPIVVVRIQDTGAGLPEEAKAHVKELLESDALNASGGAPTGFSLCKHLADGLDSTISFTSEVQRGSTFLVKMPIMMASVGKGMSVSNREELEVPPQLQGAIVLVAGRRQVLVSALDRQLSNWQIAHSVVNCSLDSLLLDLYPNGELPHVMSLGKAGAARPSSPSGGQRRGLALDYDILLADVSSMGDLSDPRKWDEIGEVMAKEDIGLVFICGSHQLSLSKQQEIKMRPYWKSRPPVFLVKPLVRQQLMLDCMAASLGDAAAAVGPLTVAPSDENLRFKGHVLFVKINAMKRRLIKSLMVSVGLTVQLGQTGADTITLFKKGKYDMVFVQCHLTDMDGWDVCKAVRAHESTNGVEKPVPVIMLMTNAVEGDRPICESAGATDFILKSPTRQTLVDILKKYLPVVQ